MLADAQPLMRDLIEMEALYAKKRQKTMAPACPYPSCAGAFSRRADAVSTFGLAPMVRLARELDWEFVETSFGAV